MTRCGSQESYEVGLPVVVQIWADRIVVRSYGGLVDGVSLDRCDGRKSLSKRKNRNRRIGDFLSNLGLTEGRGTGISRVYWEMERNGSPAPIFETDDGSYLDVA